MRAYEARINQHDFDAMVELIAPDARFLFTDGTFVGLTEIRAAFEATWAALNNDSYALRDIVWLARDEETAACTYRFHWTTEIDGRPVSGTGRGTSVLRRLEHGNWVVVHEHLSQDPQ